MQHARKMVLVPEDSINKIHQNIQNDTVVKEIQEQPILRTVQTPGTNLTRLDAELSEILNSDEANEHIKWKNYQQVLQRYLFFLKNAEKNLSPLLQRLR